MRKPKLTIGQICYFAMFCRNRQSKTESFTVHSGRVKGLEYDSENDSIDYILEIPFDISQTPKWLHRLFPRSIPIFEPVHALHHWIHKKNTYVANEDEVFYDFRDAVSDSHDYLQIQADSLN